ncbi:unnamed protein product [Diamesa serratosioi]
MLEKIRIVAPQKEKNDDLKRIRLLDFLHQNDKYIWKEEEVKRYVKITKDYMKEIKMIAESAIFLELHHIGHTVDHYFPSYGNLPFPTLDDMNSMLEKRIILNLQDKLSPDLGAICRKAQSEHITRRAPEGLPFLVPSKEPFSPLHIVYDLDCSGIGKVKNLKDHAKMSFIYGFILFGLTFPRYGRRIGAGIGVSFFGLYLAFNKVYDSLYKRAIKKRQCYKDEAVNHLSKMVPNIIQSCLAQFASKLDDDWNMNNQHLNVQVNQIIQRQSSID